MEPNPTEQQPVPGLVSDSAVQVRYLQIALKIYKASQNTPSVRDLCRFIYNCLRSTMPITQLFCVARTETGGIRFLAFIDSGGDRYGFPDRELSEDELLVQVFECGDVLSSQDCEVSEGLLGPELVVATSWMLIPLVSPARQILGAIGVCSDRADAFAETDLSLFKASAEAIMTVMARTSAMDRIVSTERERIVAETAGDLLHDAANMLGPIQAYVDMIEQALDDTAPLANKRYLRIIKSQAIEVQAAFRSKLSEIKNKMARPKVVLTDVVKLLDAARTVSETRYPDVRFLSEIDYSVPRVLVSSRDLFEVLREIIRNGQWAMRESERKMLTLRAKPWKGPDGRVWAMIEIEDIGCGIPESDLDKIWELTYSTKSSSGGYGLYRAKSVIEHFGGQISVRSRVNAGTTFEIRLPGGGIKPGAGSPLERKT